MTSNDIEKLEIAASKVSRAANTFSEAVGKSLGGMDKAREHVSNLIEQASNKLRIDFKMLYEPKVSVWIDSLRETALIYKSAADRMHTAAELIDEASRRPKQ